MPAKKDTRKTALRKRRVKGPTRKSAKKILILTMSAGEGHISAANAISKELQARNQNWNIVVADHAELIGRLRGKTLTKGYSFITSYFPRLWKIFYELADFDFPRPLFNKLRHIFSRAGERSIVNFVLDGKFDHVVCTHFASAHIISALKRVNKIDLGLTVTITDFGMHRVWLTDMVDHYTVASEYTKKEMIGAGVPLNMIHVTGIPIRKEFLERSLALKKQHWHGKGSLKLLIVETRANRQSLINLLGTIAPLKNKLDITIVGLKKQHLGPVEVYTRQLGLKAVIHGFIRNMEDYLSAADLVITKSGGLTTSEAMAMQTPMLVLRPIPGQEMTNVKALMWARAGLHARNEKEIAEYLANLITHPKCLADMQVATRKLAKPNATHDIARLIEKIVN